MVSCDNSGSTTGVPESQGSQTPVSPTRSAVGRPQRIIRQLCSVVAIVLLIGGVSFGFRHWSAARSNWYLSQCRGTRDGQNWLELREISQRWSAWDPSNVDARLFQADAANHLQEYELVAECLSAIPDSHPKCLPSLVALSTLQFGPLNRPLDGVQTCERILKLDRRATPAHHQLIEFYAVTLQRRKLEQQIRFAIESSREPPKAYVYLFLIDTMRISGASESNSRWLEHHPDSELFSVARVLHMPEPDSGVRKLSGDDKFSLVDGLFKRFPNNLELLAYKVDVSLRSGDIPEVMSLLSNLPPEADSDNRFWRAKGWLHLNRNELAKATEALNESIRLFPLDVSARNLLADVLRRESKLSDAEPLHELVQSARQLRTQINANSVEADIPNEILTELARLATQCGDTQVSAALNRRLGLHTSVPGFGGRNDRPSTAKSQ